MAANSVKKIRIGFFTHLWIPIWRAGEHYDRIELDRHRKMPVTILYGQVDYSAALASRNASISAIAQRSAILMSALSLLIGAHLVLWINAYFRQSDPSSPPMTMSTVTGQNVLIGIGFLLVALALLMTTLWFHWSANLEDYMSEEAEYNRTKALVKWRAFRVNLALLFMFVGLIVTISPYVPMAYSLISTSVWQWLNSTLPLF